MADEDPANESLADSMSLIPFDTNREVVLRHADSIVVFDPQSRQLILRNRNRGVERAADETNCPHCGRSYNETPTSSAVEDDFAEEQLQQPSFINNEYFRMLASSLPSSNRSSGPPSPRRQLVQPIAVSSPLRSSSPPPEAEFVGSTPAPPSAAHGISESAFAPNYFERFFQVEKELGRGGRGVVLLVKHVLDHVSLGHFACKRVPVGDDHAWLEKVLVEVQALQSLSHQNLVSYRHVWLQDYQINNFSPYVPCAFILQQYCNGGDLHSYVFAPAREQPSAEELKQRLRRRSRGEHDLPPRPANSNEPRRLHLDQIYQFFLDITEGLRFLHLNGFIHRDLKPQNCLLHRINGPNGTETRVLVSDFGEVQYENVIRKSTGHTGTISYCAPEVLRPVSPGGPLGNFTFKSDVFSLGMILHFLCFADLPYRTANVLHEEDEDLDELREEITNWPGFTSSGEKRRSDLPSKLYSFLKQLLSIVPETRPTSDEVLNGIKLGGLDVLPELKRRGSAGPEEMAPGRKATKVEQINGSSSRTNKPQDLDAISPTRNMALRRRPGPQSPSLNKATLHASGSSSDLLEGPSSLRLHSPDEEDTSNSTTMTAVAMRRTSSHGISRAPVLNSRPKTSPPSLPPQTERKQIESSPERKPRQLLLPPPQPTSLAQNLRTILTREVQSPLLYVLSFAAKIMTVIQPCLTSGVNSTVFYVVFVLATVELALMPHKVWELIVSGVVHLSVLWVVNEYGVWCRAAPWHGVS